MKKFLSLLLTLCLLLGILPSQALAYVGDILPSTGSTVTTETRADGTLVLQNDYIRVTLNKHDGSLTTSPAATADSANSIDRQKPYCEFIIYGSYGYGISENIRWTYQKKMKKGSFITCKAPFGYRLVKGELEIIEAEAQIIRLIFQRYLNGNSMEDIAKEITRYGIPTRDKTPYWQTTSIQYVLHNEKYAGDSLAQKTYTTRTLPHRKKRNQGEYDQYFVPGSHPAIIDRELFDRAQALLKQKGAVIHPKSGVTYPWTGTVICGQCGSIFKRKKCRESAYWTCRLHDKSPDKCQITQIPESEFERAFLRLYYKLRHHGMPVLSQLLTDLQTAQNRKLLWSLDIVELNKQIADIVRQERLLAELKQQGLVDPDIYITRSNTLAEQLRTAKLEKERFLESEEDQTIRQTQVLLEILETGPEFLEAFDEELFSELVAKIIVENNECLRFRLINGLELTETIERTVR